MCKCFFPPNVSMILHCIFLKTASILYIRLLTYRKRCFRSCTYRSICFVFVSPTSTCWSNMNVFIELYVQYGSEKGLYVQIMDVCVEKARVLESWSLVLMKIKHFIPHLERSRTFAIMYVHNLNVNGRATAANSIAERCYHKYETKMNALARKIHSRNWLWSNSGRGRQYSDW